MVAGRKTLTRRTILAASGAAAITAPQIARAQRAKVLRFVPQTDLTVLDPVFNTATVTAVHGGMVFDTLYGLDVDQRPQLQMLAGHVVGKDGREWTLTLRDGLSFHDNEPVRARDAVASIRRWASRDMFGQEILARLDEISAPDDRTIRIRLKTPFPALPAALGKTGGSICAIMPERLASVPGTQQVTEMVGSGPFRFLPDERLSGSHVAYARFENYVPRPDGVPSRSAGPKVAYFDRVEWTVVPDQSTAAAALLRGEVDWLEAMSGDLLPLFRRGGDVRSWRYADVFAGVLRFNCLQPPFDNPAIRRAILGAVDQSDFMTAAFGDDKAAWKACGFFANNSPMATQVGLDGLVGQRDPTRVKQALAAAGYNGERVVVLQANDLPTWKAAADVAADLMKQVGMNVDLQVGDWGTISQRRAKKDPVDQGGWSVFTTGITSTNDPANHLGLRANGAQAWFGWPDSPTLESLRQEWIASSDLASQKALCGRIQLQALQDVPYVPLGGYHQLSVARADLSGFGPGDPLFYGVKRG